MLLTRYPMFLILGAFLPYISISLGLRYGDIIIYSMGALFVFLAVAKKEFRINKSLLGIFGVWLVLLVYMTARTFIFGGSISNFAFLADLNNVLQPLVLILIFMLVLKRKTLEDADRIISATGKTLIFLLSLNSLWTLLGFFVDTTSINAYFWGSSEGTAFNAATNNRFSGIFNQPLEAGMAYSAGLLVWLYLLDKKFIKPGIKSSAILILMFIGGLVTVSKIFILLGVAVFIFFAFGSKVARRRMLPMIIISTVIGYPAIYYLTQTWQGLNYLLRLFDFAYIKENGLINVITAGRYGMEGSQQSTFFNQVWNNAPLIGEGLGSQTVYDSAHFYFFSTGGLIALLGYLVLIGTFLWMAYSMYVYSGNSSEFKLFLGLIVLVVAGGLGAPTLTLNRSSTIIWVFVGLLMNYLSTLRISRMEKVEIPIHSAPIKKKNRKRYRIVW